MDDIITFSETAAYGIEVGSSTIFSEPKERMSVEQCMYAIMLESANEVCLAVAEEISGSISKFVDLMNQRVKELGLKDKLADMSEEEQYALLATDGMLVKRPVLVTEQGVLTGFKPEEWEKLLG